MNFSKYIIAKKFAKSQNGSKWKRLAPIKVEYNSSTTYKVTKLELGKEYLFRVWAENEIGQSIALETDHATLVNNSDSAINTKRKASLTKEPQNKMQLENSQLSQATIASATTTTIIENVDGDLELNSDHFDDEDAILSDGYEKSFQELVNELEDSA